MAHESFEDPETAALMNRNFICIKVDREERPDLDSIYMQATTAMTGSGGWPMSVFLMPNLRPFYAGTYFPPVRRYNLPSFKELLVNLSETWQRQAGEVERVGDEIFRHLDQSPAGGAAVKSFSPSVLEAATQSLLDLYDWTDGGWGRAPKFPQPMSIEFLLRRTLNSSGAGEGSKSAALHALKSMARGGMYDVVGGGFSRYSTDNSWKIPHFEKMLYDNAQLGRAYLHAWQLTREPFYKRVVIETLDFVMRELTHAEGGFYSSLDADSEGKEGQYYVWTKDQIRNAIPAQSEFDLFVAAYGILEQGNWEGHTILQRALDDASLAILFKINLDEVPKKLADCHKKLLTQRSLRIRPGTDDKILTAWNGLMLSTFAEAARVLDDPAVCRRYLEVATRNAEFLGTHLRTGGQLRRAWRGGSTTAEVFLEDYAALILGLIELYQSDFRNHWLVTATELSAEMTLRFTDPNGGFFDTPREAETVLVRPKDLQDNATPSGNSLACEALLKLAAFTDRGQDRDVAERALELVTENANRYPTSFGRWLGAADFALADGKQIAILARNSEEGVSGLLEVIRSQYRPNDIVALSPYPPPPGAPPLLSDRPLENGRTSAYVCQNFVCKRPVHDPEELRKLI